MNLWPFICSYSRSFALSSFARLSRSSSSCFLSFMTTSFFLATRFACCLYTVRRESWLCSLIFCSMAPISACIDSISFSRLSMSALVTGGSLSAVSISFSLISFSSPSLRTLSSALRPFWTSLLSILSIASALPSPSCDEASRISRSLADRSMYSCSVCSSWYLCSANFSVNLASSSCSFRSIDVTCSSTWKPSSFSDLFRKYWIF
mmetsp:Transcript_43981/g.122322  ORF Transcript_43981/g.122322 Transcript_43981/m.122322 type:complete len:206 (+) Transcript_43981:971-1588(+)